MKMQQKLDDKNLAINLRKLRGDRSQEAIARDIGVSTSAYVKYENGQRIPRMSILFRIANYFNVDIDTLFHA